MSQRTVVVGARAPIIWLLIFVAAVVVVAGTVGVLVLLPQRNAGQHYQAGLAFEVAEEWEAARVEYMQVIGIDAAYKDAQARLAAVKLHLAGSASTATAIAVAVAGQAQATAQAEASAHAQTVTEAQSAALTATVQALEARYQRALGFVNMERWVEAQAELQAIFDTAPNYKDIQGQLALVNAEVAKLTPTTTTTPLHIPTPLVTPAPLRPIELFTDSSWKSSTEEIPEWETLAFDDSWWSSAEQLDFGNSDRIINIDSHAKWIWHPNGQSIRSPIFFRKQFELASIPSVASIAISVDDDYHLYVNGTSVGSDGGWHAWEIAEKYNITPYLVEGKNVIAVKGVNTQEGGWLLVSVFIKY